MNRPKVTEEKLLSLIPYRIDRKEYPLLIIGVRGYYLNMLGEKGKNDIGIYDDAIFIHTDKVFKSFNANTDPSKIRIGQGFGIEKGMAILKTGLWECYRFDIHGGKVPYPAICQRVKPVTVQRYGEDNIMYEDSGMLGINIHKGGLYTTSSEGCQTIYGDQWEDFYSTAKNESIRLFNKLWDKVTIPYALIENKGEI